MYVLFLKITRFLGLTLILHPGHTSRFFKTVKIKFMGPKGRGPRKTNTLLASKTNYYKASQTKEKKLKST